MDKIDLDELERLQKLAEPLPWKEDLYLTSDGDSVDAVSNIDGDMIVHTDESLLAEAFNCAYIVAACNAVPELIARVRELERERELYRERLHESWNQTEYCIDLLHDAGVNLTMWACGVESCQQCDVPECDMGDLDMVEKYTFRKAMEQAAKEAGE